MDRDMFLDRIAARLGRTRLTESPVQRVRGVPDVYREFPFGDGALEMPRVERFRSELEALGGHVEIAESRADAGAILGNLLDKISPTRIITWDQSEFADWGIDWLWRDRGAVSFSLAGCSGKTDRQELREIAATADIGVTLADFAIANTGSLVLVTNSKRARSVSLLPSSHIALIRESQIVDRSGDALQSFYEIEPLDFPSSIHFITGPSRSADIENDLTIGVHGPAAVYVIVWRD